MTQTRAHKNLPFVIACAADQHGCGWHRIFSPAQALMKAGLAYVRATPSLVGVEEITAAKPDVVVVQRQVEEGQIGYLKELRAKNPQAKIIYELDDYLSKVDRNNYHEVFLAPGDVMEERIAGALAYCDAVVAPTQILADWLSGLGGGLPAYVLPNLLPELDGPMPELIQKPKEAKVRVGWAGGISHDGDLEQLIPAINALARGPHAGRFQFVFMGMRPKGLDESLYEFYEGVPPAEFGKKWASLGLDLILAPIQDSLFNRAKSNLRLIQGGMIGAAAIASPVGPYVGTPVYSYASTPEEWEAGILAFAEASPEIRLEAKKSLRLWAKQYSMGAKVGEIAEAWRLPKAHKKASKLSKKYFVWGLDVEGLGLGGSFVQAPGDIAEAYQEARQAGAGLVVARAMSGISSKSLKALVASTEAAGVGTASAFSNDGQAGASIFGLGFVQSTPEEGDLIESALAGMGKMAFGLPYPVGPVAVISPRAVAAVAGWPNQPTLGLGLAEFGIVAAAGGLSNVLVGDAWATAMQPEGQADGRALAAKALALGALAQVMQSQEVGSYRFGAELAHLRKNHLIPRSGGRVLQQLQGWSAIYGGAAPGARQESISLMRVSVGDQESYEHALASGIKWVRFDFPGGQIHDMVLASLEEAGDRQAATLVYGDWVAIDPYGKNQPSPVFLAEPDFLYGLGRDFVSAGAIFNLKEADAFLGGMVPESRTEIWTLGQMILEKVGACHVGRLGAAAPENMDSAGRKAVVEDLWSEYSCEAIADFGLLKVQRKLEGAPKVSVIIPTTGDRWLLRPCLATLGANTGYPGEIDILLVVSGDEESRQKAQAEIEKLEEYSALDCRIVHVDGDFNYAKACNAGAAESSGDFLLFLNDDVRFSAPGWLSGLVAFGQLPDAGWVGPRLVKQDGTVQTVGVYAGEGAAFECFKGLPINDLGLGGYAHLAHRVGAVCGACGLIAKDRFIAFREDFPWNYNDVLAGYDVRKAGYSNYVYTGHDVLHLESASRNRDYEESLRRLRRDGLRLKQEMPGIDETWPKALEAKMVWRGLAAQGSRYDSLKWDDEAQKSALAKPVLALGLDMGAIGQMVRAGERVYVAGIRNQKLHFLNPAIAGLADGIPLERADIISKVLDGLGIAEVALVPSQNEETVLSDLASGWGKPLRNGG